MRFPPLCRCALIAPLLWSGCVVGPDYEKPVTSVAATYEHPIPGPAGMEKTALPKEAWWTVFKDPVLDRLEQEATAASPTIRAAVARRDQAWALARVDRSALFPQATVSAGGERSRVSDRLRASTRPSVSTTISLPVDLSYEVDLWGRVRRTLESGVARAEASEADYRQILLGVQADVARAYFSLRALDEERELLRQTVESRGRALEIVRRRFELGAGNDFEVSVAETERASAEGDLLAVEQERTAVRHALAVLTGRLPESFALELTEPSPRAVPAIPVGLPSELLERRPDVAAAERTLASVHAQIGVALAAYFPSIRLVGSGGYASDELGSLLSWGNREWSFAPSISLPLFTGGRNRANEARARALYDEAAANYRQQVLVAFQEVETALSDLARLAERGRVLDRAVASSRRAADLVGVRYRAGRIGYLDVTDAERTAIGNQRLAVQVRALQFAASVTLVKALGGGW